MSTPDSTVHADNLERMLADNLRQREQIADRVRERIAALEGELPRLHGMLASLESCGVQRVEIVPPDLSEMGRKLAGAIDEAKKTYGRTP